MGLLTKIENRLVVPRKYLLNSDSKSKHKGTSLPVPWLRLNHKKSMSRSRHTSQDSSDQKTKDTLKPGDISNLEEASRKSPRTASKWIPDNRKEFNKFVIKKTQKKELKKMNILYTSWNIKI